MSIRIGVIGCGAIARTHMGILKSHKDVVLGAAHDVDASRAGALAAEFQMSVYENLDDFWDQIDAVYITAPNRFHAQLTLDALKEGKHVFCEKPFALSLAEAEEIRDAVERNRGVYQLGFNRRCAPAYQKIKQCVNEGSFKAGSFNIKMNRGELQNPAWTSDSKITGGFLFESTLHLLDTLRFLFGEVKEVKAIGSKNVYSCVDNFSLLFAMENGVHGVFSSCAHASWSFPFERVEVYGEHASVFNDEMEGVTFCQGLDSPVTSMKFSTLPINDRWGYTLENQIFIDRILSSDVPPGLYADEKDGFANVSLIESIYHQIGLGK